MVNLRPLTRPGLGFRILRDHPMGESLKQLLQLLRGLSASVMHKVSHISTYFLQHKNLGAIAGLAIALVCTWKLFKNPNSQKRVENRRNAANAPSDGEAVPRSITQIEEPVTSPQELTLAETVRRQLLGARRATCQLLGVISEETTPEEIQKHAVVRPAVIDVLVELARSCDLYLFARTLDDESEEIVMAALDAAGIFSEGHLSRNKVLFYGTDMGSNSFVRQLEPEWHVDTSSERVGQLARFVRHQILVSPSIAASTLPSNVFKAESLESYFRVPKLT